MANSVGFSIVLFFMSISNVFGIEDYCSKNTYNESSQYMHFTKEATLEEFALEGKFKGLHCCAKGYTSIEWFKDGVPYPWALHVSDLILFPESANQTIYTQKVTETDAGNYTCVLKNDTVHHTHTIHLKVFDKVQDDPKITYISENKNLVVGRRLRIFCEAFAGQVDLPDAHSEAVWRKIDSNGTICDVPDHAQQLKSNREDGQIFGTYLIIPEVQNEDFGDYVCVINSNGNTLERRVSVQEEVKEESYINPNPVPVGKLIFIMSAILFTAVAIIMLYLRYGLKVQVKIKDSFSHLEENDGKSSDVLIVYSPADTDIALGVLMNTLKNNYNYTCTTKELSSNTSLWYSDLKDEAQKCRRILALFSPAAINGNWDTNSILQALKQLQSLGTKFICVSLKSLPNNPNEVKNSQGETLSSVKRSIGIILWERKQDMKFWYALRLRLPAKRRTDFDEEKKLTQGETNLRLNSDSQESLDNLV